MVAAVAMPAHAADQTTQARVDMARDNSIPDSALRPPLRFRWENDLGLARSNILVANGRVFLVAWDRIATRLFALDSATGAVAWAVSLGVDGSPGWGLAYDGGRVFVARLRPAHEDSGVVAAFDAGTGAVAWDTSLPSVPDQYAVDGPPVAANGVLYLVGTMSGSRAFALRQSDGMPLWDSPLPGNGIDATTPTVDASSVYITYGSLAFALDRANGATRWSTPECCYDFMTTGVLHDGLCYAGDRSAFNPATGARVPTNVGSAPTSAAGLAVYSDYARLHALDAAGAERWTYAPFVQGDGVRSPLGAGAYVYAIEGERYVTGVDATTG